MAVLVVFFTVAGLIVFGVYCFSVWTISREDREVMKAMEAYRKKQEKYEKRDRELSTFPSRESCQFNSPNTKIKDESGNHGGLLPGSPLYAAVLMTALLEDSEKNAKYDETPVAESHHSYDSGHSGNDDYSSSSDSSSYSDSGGGDSGGGFSD